MTRDPTQLEVLLRYVILGASWFACGIAATLGVGNLVALFTSHEPGTRWWHRDWWALAYLGARVTFVVMVMLITSAVAQARLIPDSWQARLYAGAAVLAVPSYIGIAAHHRWRRRHPQERRFTHGPG